MSVEAITIALHHSMSAGTVKLVLIGIANHDGDGGAWPSLATLARYTGKSRRVVQRALEELVALGEIVVHHNAGGDRTTRADQRPNLYRITLSCPPDCDGTKHHRLPGDPGYGVTPASPRRTRRGDVRVTRSAPTTHPPSATSSATSGAEGGVQSTAPRQTPRSALRDPHSPQNTSLDPSQPAQDARPDVPSVGVQSAAPRSAARTTREGANRVTYTSPRDVERGDVYVAHGVTPASPEPSLEPNTPQPPASGGRSCARHDTPAPNCRGCGTTNRDRAAADAAAAVERRRDANAAARAADLEAAQRADAARRDPASAAAIAAARERIHATLRGAS